MKKYYVEIDGIEIEVSKEINDEIRGVRGPARRERYAKSVQGDTGHAKADTLLNTYSHIEDERRASLTMAIAKDFYGEDIVNEVMSNDKEIDDDIIKRITSDPELQKRTLAALLGKLG